MNKVCAVFSAFGDGDCYTRFDLEGLSFTLYGAHTMIADQEAKRRLTENAITNAELVHENMKKSNNYTYIGSRKDVDSMCEYGWFGGYVIEEMEVVD